MRVFLFFISILTINATNKKRPLLPHQSSSENVFKTPPRIDTTKFTQYSTTQNKTLYTQQLQKAYAFSRAIFEGLHLEILEWTQNPNVILTATQETQRIYPEIPRLARETLTLHKITIKALQVRTRWYLYTVALRNLIRYTIPCEAFFEFVVNMRIEFENENAMEDVFVNYVMMTRRRESLMKMKKVSTSEDSESVEMRRKIDELKTDVQRLRKTSKSKELLVVKLEQISLKMQALAADFETLSDISDALQENIAHIRFAAFFDPLLKDTAFSKVLDQSTRTVRLPKMDKLKPTIEAAMDQYYAFIHVDNPTFMFERVRLTSPYIYLTLGEEYEQKLDDNISTPESVAYIQSKFQYTVDYYVEKLKERISFYSGTLFTPNSVAYEPRTVIDTLSKPLDIPAIVIPTEDDEFSDDFYQPYSPIQHHQDLPPTFTKHHLKFRHLTTLKRLMGHPDHLNGATTIKWIDIVQMIESMKGTVIPNGGSIRMIQLPLPASFPIRFDQPHPETTLGASVFSLRRIFRRWGVSVDNYE